MSVGMRFLLIVAAVQLSAAGGVHAVGRSVQMPGTAAAALQEWKYGPKSRQTTLVDGPMRLRGGGLYAASLTRWQHADMSITEPVHMTLVVNTTTVSWIGRSSVKEMLSLIMRKCVAKTKPGDFARIEHEIAGKKCYFYVISRTNGLAGTLVTDEAYPQRVAINLIELAMDDFSKDLLGQWPQSRADDCVPYPKLTEYLETYQDSAKADKIERLKKDVEESKKILQQSVDAILERGEKLEDLVMHSNKLSMQTKMMYKSVQKKPGWLEECLGCSPA